MCWGCSGGLRKPTRPPATTPPGLRPAVLLALLVPLALAEPAPWAPAPEPVTTTRIGRDPDGIGIGAMLGLPTGLSLAYKPKLDGVWADAAVAWDFSTGTLAVHAEVMYTLATLHSPDIEEFSFPLYVGVGPRFRLGPPISAYAPSIFALRVPIGMAFYHEGVPVEGFLEAAVGLGVIPRVRGEFDVAIGGRFYLP